MGFGFDFGEEGDCWNWTENPQTSLEIKNLGIGIGIGIGVFGLTGS